MSDERNSTTDGETQPDSWDVDSDPDGYTLDDIRPKDFFLDAVLDFVVGLEDDFHGNTINLTVTSNGVVVSGRAISRADWLAGVVEQYKNAGADVIGNEIEKVFKLAHEHLTGEATRRRSAGLPAYARGFLHMRDVRVGVGDQFTQLPLWRGKLSDITGWSLGSWNPNPDESASPSN